LMSALPSTTDLHQRGGYVSFVPRRDIRAFEPNALYAYLTRVEEFTSSEVALRLLPVRGYGIVEK
jgi:hypothetical protein